MNRIVYIATVLLFCTALQVQAGIAVIVSSTSPASNLDQGQVSDIFLGKSPTFPDGSEAVAVDYKEGVALRETFHAGSTGKTQAQLKAYWSKMLFSGKGTPPKEVTDADSMKKLIAGNPSMIGYIDSSAVDSSVKVIFSF